MFHFFFLENLMEDNYAFLTVSTSIQQLEISQINCHGETFYNSSRSDLLEKKINMKYRRSFHLWMKNSVLIINGYRNTMK